MAERTRQYEKKQWEASDHTMEQDQGAASRLPAVRVNPQIVPRIERIQTEQLGLDIGPIRQWLLEFERANSKKRTFSTAGGLVDQAFLARITTTLGAELADYIEELRHRLELDRIGHASAEHRLSTQLRTEQSLRTFKLQADIILEALAYVEEIKAKNPKAGAEIERQILSDLKATLRTYNAPIHDDNPDDRL